MNLIILGLITLCVILNTAAQITLKFGMTQIGTFGFILANLVPISLKIMTSPYIITGTLMFGISFIVWLLVISRIPISIAYPITSLAYVTNAIAAYLILSEDLNLTRIIGIIVILTGVMLVSKS